MDCELRMLSVDDGRDVYDMLQAIGKNENGFMNAVNGMTFDEYRAWLVRSDEDAKMTGIVDGWKVPQSTFWLYADGRPVGTGKIRHFLTDAERNRGYGKILLGELLKEAKKLGIDRALITVKVGNDASLKVALANGGAIERTNEVRHYIWIDC